jgi:predicted PurR-regulated permease PerM
MLIGIVIKLLSGYARKYPDLTETIAIITSLIVGGVMLGMAGIFAAVYHHLITGKP